jgi:hypothetical protein
VLEGCSLGTRPTLTNKQFWALTIKNTERVLLTNQHSNKNQKHPQLSARGVDSLQQFLPLEKMNDKKSEVL